MFILRDSKLFLLHVSFAVFLGFCISQCGHIVFIMDRYVSEPLRNINYHLQFIALKKPKKKHNMHIYIEVACWMHSGERQAAKMRMAYLRSMLSQDISLFDTEASTGEVISAITSDIIVVQDAISEKVCSF